MTHSWDQVYAFSLCQFLWLWLDFWHQSFFNDYLGWVQSERFEGVKVDVPKARSAKVDVHFGLSLPSILDLTRFSYGKQDCKLNRPKTWNKCWKKIRSCSYVRYGYHLMKNSSIYWNMLNCQQVFYFQLVFYWRALVFVVGSPATKLGI